MRTLDHPSTPFSYAEPRRGGHRRRVPPGLTTAIVLSLAAHGLIAAYLWKAKFQPHYRIYAQDQATQVTLIPPPPPPPPKAETPPKPPPPHHAPPRVHPRPPRPTPTIGEIAPLPIPPLPEKAPAASPPILAVPPAPKPAPPPKPHVITQPTWRHLPSPADMARYYPDRAQRLGIEGRAVLSCTVAATGVLEHCAVAEESPPDQDFGAAALKMRPLFAISPMTRDGEPVAGATVRIPLRFRLPK